ncbi:MAG: radical SAM protein, partial [Synechococcaceae cyanobacterium]
MTAAAGSRPLLGLGRSELEQWAERQGQPAFRGRQLHDWLYARGARSLDQVTVLPMAWRQQLAAAPPEGAADWLGRSRELHRSLARDGTTKLLLATHDGLSLETVGIPAEGRLTVCVSSQVGCPMACRFCATGKEGLQRSLAVHEIVDQVLSVREVMGERPSHVVFMGMGEPLLNSEAVLDAIACL